MRGAEKGQSGLRMHACATGPPTPAIQPTPHVWQVLDAHAEPGCPDDGHRDPRTNVSSNDGFAIIDAG
eukprot:15476984-Alexandrium_andersonii.AAC.1